MFPPLSAGTGSGGAAGDGAANGQANASMAENGLSFLRSLSRSSTPGGGTNSSIAGQPSGEYVDRDPSASDQSYFSSIYSHYQSLSPNKSTSHLNDKYLIVDMYSYYYANEELNYISSELDTFDGRKDTDRCSALVNSLKLAQDRVITLIFRIMDEIGCERATREYRLKFPDELLAGEGIESLNSQIWFGAECLAAGSTITNNQAESNFLRPIANNLTATLEQVRYDLRSCCDYLPKRPKISRDLIRRLESFDRLFTSFEYDYVKAMLPIKSAEDIESLQELTFLFSETLTYSLRKQLILKDDVEGCQPSVMIALPRLSIVRGLLHGYGSVVCKLNVDDLSSILRPYHSLLLQFHEFLINLNEEEIDFLEQLLSNNYTDNDLTLNNDDFLCVTDNANINPNDYSDQNNLLSYYNKFMKYAKKYHHQNHLNSGRVKYSKASLNKYISSSVDLLLINKTDDATTVTTTNQQGGNHCGFVRYSPICKPQKTTLFRSFSVPNINFVAKSENPKQTVVSSNNNNKEGKGTTHFVTGKSNTTPSSSSSSSTYASTNSSLESAASSASSSSSSNSYPNFSLITTSSSSASSLSNEVDFYNQFKEILKRSHRSSIAKHRSSNANVRPFSSNCPPTSANYTGTAVDNLNQRSMTTTGVRLEQGAPPGHSFAHNQSAVTPVASTALSSNSIHIDLDSIHFDELTQVTICKRKILHQVFVMLSKIADKFQTNYASELRNILRTVFLLQEIEDAEEVAKMQASFVQPVDVQLAHYSSDNIDLDIVEEGIDANEFLMGPVDIIVSASATSSSQTSQTNELEQQQTLNTCDTCDTSVAGANVAEEEASVIEVCSDIALATTVSPTAAAVRSSSLDEGRSNRKSSLDGSSRDAQRSGTFISSSYPSIKDTATDTTATPSSSLEPAPVASTAAAPCCSSKACSQSLPSLLDRSSPGLVHGGHQSALSNRSTTGSNSSLSSSHSVSQSNFTSSTTTTIDERFEGHQHMPTFFLPAHSDASFNSTSYFAHSMMPIPESVSEGASPSSGPSSNATRNLLLPPTWIPDELVNTCSLCAQLFNLIRRRHHCRRCGNIFCHQCSNNFVSLKCFGYAKPVRVCNRCLVLHEQSLLSQHVPSTTTTPATTSATTSYGA